MPEALASWLGRRSKSWRRLAASLERQRGRAPASLSELMQLVQGFRSLARDLSLARAIMPGGRVTQELEGLFLQAHEVVYRRRERLGHRLLYLFRDEIPAVMWALRRALLAVTALFVLSILTGWWLVSNYPDLAPLFASEAMVEEVQAGRLWTDGLLNVMPSAVLSLSIMANNIVVTLTAFVLGALYGLGTLYIIGLNGLMLGGVFALAAQHGLGERLLAFVVAHGVVELSVICIAGAAGAQLGEAIVRPGDRSRAEAFRGAVSRASSLLPACALFLVGAGLIEGYVSPDERFPLSMRLAVGLAYGAVFWSIMTGQGWRWLRPGQPGADGIGRRRHGGRTR